MDETVKSCKTNTSNSIINIVIIVVIICILIQIFKIINNNSNNNSTLNNNYKTPELISKQPNKNNKTIDNTQYIQSAQIVKNKKHNKKHKNNKHNKPDKRYVYMTISVDQHETINLGKIVIKLFDNVVPKTCNNFRTLVKYKRYNGCPFHRIIKDFMIQGGDYENKNGTGGSSIYGEKFEDENFEIQHDRPYLLSMANAGPNTNGSQFFITTSEAPHLDNKHVVFGEVIKGFEIIDKLNNVKTNSSDKPEYNIFISKCGFV